MPTPCQRHEPAGPETPATEHPLPRQVSLNPPGAIFYNYNWQTQLQFMADARAQLT